MLRSCWYKGRDVIMYLVLGTGYYTCGAPSNVSLTSSILRARDGYAPGTNCQTARGGSRNATDGVLVPRLRFAKQNGVVIVWHLSSGMLPGQSPLIILYAILLQGRRTLYWLLVLFIFFSCYCIVFVVIYTMYDYAKTYGFDSHFEVP